MAPQSSPESFDFEGWQRALRFLTVVFGTVTTLIVGGWTFMTKIYAPYKAKRDKARLVELERMLRQVLAPDLKLFHEAAAHSAECTDQVTATARHFARVAATLTANIGDIAHLLRLNHMLIIDHTRAWRFEKGIPEPPSTEDDGDPHFHEILARVVATSNLSKEEIDVLAGEPPPRQTPPRTGGRRKTDPPGPIGSEL